MARYSPDLFQTLRASCNPWGQKSSLVEPIIQGLPALDKSVLVVWGAQDDLLPVKQAQIVKDKAPDVRVEIFEGCKHDPMITNPDKFNRLALEFLTE